MKLLIITAASSYKNSVKKLLAENQVITYSYNPVTGYRDSTQDAVDDNWFASEMNKTESFLFFAMVPDQLSDNIFHSVEALNKANDMQSRVHIAITSIEKSN
ncbi:hypothetical protein GCM10022216_17350 [Sphingobacterium kyonggiense]|uniref:Uncharacterized protein n=1 Tax=Sphingobacterium kyonggiense TaxID=714075 RepID=A0ABP7YPI6_9SPHI